MTSNKDGGFSFNFKLPSEGLALRSVSIENGIPRLTFDPALKVPTLTEEDIGIACHLACKEARPEFVYVTIPSHHPYFGRQYMHHSPAWLRGTSVGELLAEADWTMKCLNIGARSDKKKEKFWAWQETSNLVGLANALDFPHEKSSGSVIMSCESVEIEKSENEMVFIGEPKIQIKDDANSTYTKYISEIFPSIAYHDEPLFLKVQELIKLILAAEWLKEKKVRFSRPWMMECSTAKSQKASQAVEVKSKGLGEDEVKGILWNEILKRLPEPSQEQTIMTNLGPMTVDTVVEKSITASGIEAKVTETVVPSTHTSPKVEQTTIIRASVNDYDMLYSGLDPNMPIVPELPGDTRKVVPKVESWAELFSQTVPWPRVWVLPYNGEVLFSSGGGVRTSSIPVTERVAEQASRRVQVPTREAERERERVKETARQDQYVKYSNGAVGVEATRGRKKEVKKVPAEMVRADPQRVFNRPDNNVVSNTRQTVQNRSEMTPQGYGWDDPGGGQNAVYDRSGDNIGRQRSMRKCVQQQTRVNGKLKQKASYGGAIPSTTVTQRGQKYQAAESVKSKSETVHQRRPLQESRSITSKASSTPQNEAAHSLAQQQVVQPARAATSNPLSPASSVSSLDSGIASLPGAQQPHPLAPQQHARPVTNNPLSPASPVSSLDSGFASLASASPYQQQHPMAPPQQQVLQPARAATNDLLSPASSVSSLDSGISSISGAHPTNQQPHPLAPQPPQQQVVQPARAVTNYPLSPTSSVSSLDSGIASPPGAHQQPHPLLAQLQQQVVQPSLQSPTSTVSSDDSGFASPPPEAQQPQEVDQSRQDTTKEDDSDSDSGNDSDTTVDEEMEED